MTTVSRLAIITTHPIQYNAPVFNLLTIRGKIQIKVFYTWETGTYSFDKGFGKEVMWDIPLLDGYEYEFVSNNGNKKRGFWDIKNPSLIKSILSWAADAVLIYGWNYYSHLNAMRYFKGKIPVLFRGDSTLLDEKKGVRLLARRILLRWVYKNIDIGVYVGQNNKDYYLKHGVKENCLYFAPHAIDNSRFESSSSDQINSLKNNLNLEDKKVIFLFAGKLEEKKNPLLLIEAFKQIKGNEIFLLIVGSGSLEAKVKEAILPDNRIKLLPFQNQTIMPLIYKLSSVFVLPSKGPGETWGLAVNEAMACGIPVIVTDKVGCAIDIVKEGVTGFVFASGQKEQLKNKLLLCMNTETCRNMGKKAHEYISYWSFDNLASSIENIVLHTTKE